MPAIVVLGAQWGDEGKGKATDLLARPSDRLLRPLPGRQQRRSHRSWSTARSSPPTCCPAGILTPGATSVIANGVVVAPEALFREIDGLEARGVDASRLLVSGQRAPDHAATTRRSTR